MALHKAKRGPPLTWIGILLRISVGERLVVAEVPKYKLVDVEMLTKDFLGTNVVPTSASAPTPAIRSLWFPSCSRFAPLSRTFGPPCTMDPKVPRSTAPGHDRWHRG